VNRPWTAALGSPELWPPAAPVSTGAGQGAGEREWGAGSAVGGSPGRERWFCGRERRMEERGEVWSAPRALGVAFIGPEEGAGGVAGVTAAMNGY
jgi:hypothetical protein